MKKSGVYILLASFVILLGSCSVSFEKRRYRPGYHIEVSKKQNRNAGIEKRSESIVENVKNNVIPATTDIETTKEITRELTAVKVEKEQANPHAPASHQKRLEKKKRDLDSCDVIFTAKGQRIQAKIIEITDEYIHYKNCDDPTGRLFSIKSKEVDNVTLRNGELYIPPNRVIVDKEKERKKSGILFGLAIASLSIAVIAFVFSFFIPPFAGISFGLSVFNIFFSFILLLLDIRPGKYAPSYRTKLTWIFCVIAMILFIAAMVIVFL